MMRIRKRKITTNIINSFYLTNLLKNKIMKLRFIHFISVLCLAIIMVIPTENALAQGKRGGERGHVQSRRASTMHVRGPQYGTIRNRVPTGAKQMNFRGETFHWHNGVYYHPNGKRFVVVRPPVGLRIGVLPIDCFMLTMGAVPYYYYYGTFYTTVNNEYEVVDPPIGALVEELPSDCEEVTIDDKVYYKVDDTYYRAVVDKRNKIMFEVVGKSVK